MSRFNISKARKKQIKRIAITILKEPRAIMAIGALFVAIGIYTATRAEPLPFFLIVCGCIGLTIGTLRIRQYKNMMPKGIKARRKEDIRKRNRLVLLIACALVVAAFGIFRMWNEVPLQSSIIAIGALISGIGIAQIKTKRTHAKKNSERQLQQRETGSTRVAHQVSEKQAANYGDDEARVHLRGRKFRPVADIVKDAGLELDDESYYMFRNVDELTEDIASRPYDALPYFHRGNLYRIANLNELALNDLNKAISLDPNHYLAYLNRGRIYLATSMYDRAIDDFSTAIAINPEGDHFPYQDRANVYRAIGRDDLAVQDTRMAQIIRRQFLERLKG